MTGKNYTHYDIDSKFVAHSLNESLNISDRNPFSNRSLDFNANLTSQAFFLPKNQNNFHNQKQIALNDSQPNKKFSDSFNHPISFQQIDSFKQQVINTSLNSEINSKKENFDLKNLLEAIRSDILNNNFHTVENMKSISKQVSTVVDMETLSVDKAENLLTRITKLEEKLVLVTEKTIGINNGLNEVIETQKDNSNSTYSRIISLIDDKFDILNNLLKEKNEQHNFFLKLSEQLNCLLNLNDKGHSIISDLALLKENFTELKTQIDEIKKSFKQIKKMTKIKKSPILSPSHLSKILSKKARLSISTRSCLKNKLAKSPSKTIKKTVKFDLTDKSEKRTGSTSIIIKNEMVEKIISNSELNELVDLSSHQDTCEIKIDSILEDISIF